MKTINMDCGSCGGRFTITIIKEPEKHEQVEDLSWLYFCPACSSAEESTIVGIDLASGPDRTAIQEVGPDWHQEH